MANSSITARPFDPSLPDDQKMLKALWQEYAEYFYLAQTQSEYYDGEFSVELRELNSSGATSKKVYFFQNGESPPSIMGMSMLCSTTEPTVCEIKKVLISEKFRGQGYGKRAIELILHEAKAQKFTKCKLDVLETESGAASAVYRKSGWV